MGFNNAGAAALADAAGRALGPLGVPLGISLGKSKVTPLDDAVDDYLRVATSCCAPYGDYFAVNVSSPNTPGPARAAGPGAPRRARWRALARAATPVLVKIAPDLTDAAIAELLEVCAGARRRPG